VRLFDLGDHFTTAYTTLRRRLRNERLACAQADAGQIGAVIAGLLTMAGA
jgi:hypothetical protein